MRILDQEAARLFIGNSPKVRRVIDQIERMADQGWPVLILGETGTGKELIARLIHQRGSGGPFVVIDCSAIPPQLMESELFGHVKGAFTGASTSKTGLIEMANGGAAFFDEVGELPIEMQAKLLRVLQEKEFRPVGATFTRRSHFRIIAATNRELAVEADKGTFRRDLYYRLKVITVRLPPLRERREDIPSLIDYFLTRFGRSHSLAPETLRALMDYDWPGNVRELENCVQHMVAVTESPLLRMNDMPSTVIASVVGSKSPLLGSATLSPGVSPDLSDGDAILPLAVVERREILRAVQHTKGDRTAAAALLGIGRTTLYRKLKEYGCED
jgi:transcriptional regulator with PAS, ATPase and Fis domain